MGWFFFYYCGLFYFCIEICSFCGGDIIYSESTEEYLYIFSSIVSHVRPK